MQQRWRFDDPTAHHLALLAMEQFGRMLAGLRPGLASADSRAAIRRALRDGRVPVWMPTAMVLGRPEIAESWEVTSDSLALWLAGEIGARRVILVKSAPAPSGPLTALDLARRGLVDPAFPAFLEKSRCEAFYTGPEQGETYAQAVLHSPRIGGPRGGRCGKAAARDHGE